jgi:hypothetical protein
VDAGPRVYSGVGGNHGRVRMMRRRLLGFVDKGVLFQSSNDWELMLPNFFDQLRAASVSKQSFKLDLALFSVLQGFDAGSAGAELEGPVLEWCHSSNLLPGSMPLVAFEKKNLGAIFGRTFTVTGDHGADALCLRKAGNVVQLSLIQIKLGKGGKITYGGMAGMWSTGADFHAIYRRAIVAAEHFRSKVCPNGRLCLCDHIEKS